MREIRQCGNEHIWEELYMKKRESFNNKWGFILACIGSAVGMGNIWMFPYRVGQYGGAAFLLIYIVISILVNLLDHVINFPVLRGIDWLLGGVLGLLKATVVVALVMAILPTLAESLVPELAQKFISGSKLLNVAQRFDLLNAAGEVRRLMMGG